MSFFEIFQMIGENVWIYGGTFLLVLGILVFVHEWGHYIVAKMCGVHVESFSVGFGKEIWGFNDGAGTRWKLSLIPLGGFVKLYGDTDPASAGHTDKVEGEEGEAPREMTTEERSKAFFAKPVWQRALVVFAGPAINYIFAIILLAGLYFFQGQPVTPPSGAAVIVGSAAEKAGFQPHDMIVEIDNKSIQSFEDIRREMMIALDDKKHFALERNGQEVDIMASPERVESEDRFGFKNSRGLLGLISPRHGINVETITAINGQEFDETVAKVDALKSLVQRGEIFRISMPRGEDDMQTLIVNPVKEMNPTLFEWMPSQIEVNDNVVDELGEEIAEIAAPPAILFLSDQDANVFVKHGPLTSFSEAIKQSYVITRGTLEALGQMITGARSAKELGGIIRIGAIAGDMAQRGLVAIILFTALLSINLGLINLFPIPLLDGGHLVFYALEALRGKPVPEEVQEYAFRAGLAVLVCLMVFANINDIMQLIL